MSSRRCPCLLIPTFMFTNRHQLSRQERVVRLTNITETGTINPVSVGFLIPDPHVWFVPRIPHLHGHNRHFNVPVVF